MSGSMPFLLPLAGEGGPAKPGRMRGHAAAAEPAAIETAPIMSRRIVVYKREPSKRRGRPMTFRRSKQKLARARTMRSKPTKAEEILWRSLRDKGLGIKFRRQAPIGPYIADFACLPAKLVVELDGPPHEKAEQQAFDLSRDVWFRAHGWTVVRVPNEIVFGGGDMVLDCIKAALPQLPSSDPASRGHLLPQAGEGRAEEDC